MAASSEKNTNQINTYMTNSKNTLIIYLFFCDHRLVSVLTIALETGTNRSGENAAYCRCSQPTIKRIPPIESLSPSLRLGMAKTTEPVPSSNPNPTQPTMSWLASVPEEYPEKHTENPPSRIAAAVRTPYSRTVK